MREFLKKFNIKISRDYPEMFKAAKEQLERRGNEIFDFEKYYAFDKMVVDIAALRDSLAEERDNALYCYILSSALRLGEKELVSEISKPNAAFADEKYDILPLFGLLDLVPDMLSIHKERGLPEKVSRDSLEMFENQVGDYILLNHRYGISDYVSWMWGFLRGDIIRVGRFNFEICKYDFPYFIFKKEEELSALYSEGISENGEFHFGIGADGEKISLAKSEWIPILSGGERVVSVHIPSGGRLTEEVCDRDIALGREIITRGWGEISAFVCHSWLLDPNLSRIIGKETNLTRFAKRFMLLPGEGEGNEVFEYVWNLKNKPRNLSTLSDDTGLKMVIKEHLLRGGNILGGYGIFL